MNPITTRISLPPQQFATLERERHRHAAYALGILPR